MDGLTVYHIEELTGFSGTISLPEDLSAAVGRPDRVSLSAGALTAAAKCSSARFGFDGSAIGLSPDVRSGLHLPLDWQCLARAGVREDRGAAAEAGAKAGTGAWVYLGPVVGALVSAAKDDLTPGRLNPISNHFLSTMERGGLFVAFSRDSVDLEKRCIRGFRLLPGGGNDWESGVYPLPSAIFRRYGVGFPARLRRSLRSIGVKTSNERVFHKVEAHHWMAAEAGLLPHLPETRELTGGLPVVLQMLERLGAVYVKPAWGSLGRGVLRVTKVNGGFSVEAGGEPRREFAATDALESYLGPRLPRFGLVQQALPLASVGGRLVDFRVILQKDGTGHWTVPGIVGRCGSPKLHVSNMAAGGFPVRVEDALALLFGSNPITVFRRKEELVTLSVMVGKALERGGLILGDLGLDLAYDTAGHPWVIEANNRDPDHNIAWEVGDWPLFYRARSLPAEYTVYLAGFGHPGDRGGRGDLGDRGGRGDREAVPPS